jgi:hypothetical protein
VENGSRDVAKGMQQSRQRNERNKQRFESMVEGGEIEALEMQS